MDQTHFYISQIFVIIAMFFDYISMQQSSRKRIFFYLCISATIIALHYLILGFKVAFIFELLIAIRFFICMFSSNKKILMIFLIINVIVLYLKYTTPIELIFFFGITISLIGNFIKSKKTMRLMMISGTSFTIIYTCIIFSPAAIVLESIFLFSQIKGFLRYNSIKKKIKNKKKI